MIAAHRAARARATVGLYSATCGLDLGVSKPTGNHLFAIHRKTRYRYDVSMGVYVLEPPV